MNTEPSGVRVLSKSEIRIAQSTERTNVRGGVIQTLDGRRGEVVCDARAGGGEWVVQGRAKVCVVRVGLANGILDVRVASDSSLRAVDDQDLRWRPSVN